jgi:hypothetical protein
MDKFLERYKLLKLTQKKKTQKQKTQNTEQMNRHTTNKETELIIIFKKFPTKAQAQLTLVNPNKH